MNAPLRNAIRDLLEEAKNCSQDNDGYIQGMSMHTIAMLLIEYNKYCKKHGRPVIE